jgi:hypothetical protein
MKGWMGPTRRAHHLQRQSSDRGLATRRSGNEEILKRVHQSVFTVSVPEEAMPLVVKMLEEVCVKTWEKPEKFFFVSSYKNLCDYQKVAARLLRGVHLSVVF